LNRDDFELLLLALGHQLSSQEIEACLRDLGVDPQTNSITYELFHDWWTDSMGVQAIRKKYMKK